METPSAPMLRAALTEAVVVSTANDTEPAPVDGGLARLEEQLSQLVRSAGLDVSDNLNPGKINAASARHPSPMRQWRRRALTVAGS